MKCAQNLSGNGEILQISQSKGWNHGSHEHDSLKVDMKCAQNLSGNDAITALTSVIAMKVDRNSQNIHNERLQSHGSRQCDCHDMHKKYRNSLTSRCSFVRLLVCSSACLRLSAHLTGGVGGVY